MNTFNSSHICLLATAAAAAMCVSPVLAGGDKPRSSIRERVYVSGDGPAVFAGQGHVVEIRVENGEVEVFIDGEEIPADRFIQEDGRIVILDEDGNELESIGLAVGLGDADDAFNFAWVAPQVENTFWFQPDYEPKVMIGVHIGEPGDALRYHLRLEKGETTMISGLYEGLPAHDAGLDQYDIIIGIDGKRPAGPKALVDALAEKEPGDEITLTVIREGRTRDVHVELEEFDRSRMDESKLIGDPAMDRRIVIPGLEGRIQELLIDPERNQIFRWRDRGEDFSDRWQERLEEQLRKRLPRDLDERMERLNEQIDELKDMLDRLVDEYRDLSDER